MLCRVAEEVFWLSRYVERSLAVVRLIDVTLHLELDAGDRGESDVALWAPLIESQGFGAGDWLDDLSSGRIRQTMAFDAENPNSLIACTQQARNAARGVREAISSEMWEQINTGYLQLAEPRLKTLAEEDPAAFYKRFREGAQFLQGLADATLAHDEAWQFLSLGKWLERIDNVARVLRVHADILTGAENADDEASTVRWLAVLRSCGCAEAYARYYSLRVEPARVIEFLLFNPVFPQSIRYCANAAWAALRDIAGSEATMLAGASPAIRAMGRLRATVEHAAIDEVLVGGLKPFLDDIQRQNAFVSDLVTQSYLRDQPQQPTRHIAAARAAQIMAAQQ